MNYTQKGLISLIIALTITASSISAALLIKEIREILGGLCLVVWFVGCGICRKAEKNTEISMSVQ
ncbi:MAG: hypothetical protein AB1485_07440 [Candidatus Thermoplasmatota archaeon]